MPKPNPLNEIPIAQILYLHKMFGVQQKAENHVSIDFLPYTVQIKWLVAEMLKRFPKSPWTEKLVYRTLIRLRKADLVGKTERGGNEQPPQFPDDNDHGGENEKLVFQEEGEV
jgi:hypothetical protein